MLTLEGSVQATLLEENEMKRTTCILTLLCAFGVATSAFSASIDYRETWDAYAAGTGDPTYNAVWNPIEEIQPSHVPIMGAGPFVSGPNRLQVYVDRNRAMLNPLNDGVTNGTTAGAEMGAGGYVVPTANAPLSFGLSVWIDAATSRRHTPVYTTLGKGNAYPPIGQMSLAEPINVLAVGNLANHTWGESNNNMYFFNGQEWIRLINASALESAAVTDGWNHIQATIFDDGGVWMAEVNAGYDGAASQIVPLAIDPTAEGFDTVGYFNHNPNYGATWSVDDIWVAGGSIIPEPMTALLLAIGIPAILRRRRV